MIISEILRPSNISEFDQDKFQTLSRELAEVDLDNIDKELCSQTIIYTYYHGMMQSARRIYEEAITDLETYIAVSKTKIRTLAREESQKLPSVGELDDQVISTMGYSSRKQKCISTQEIYGLVKSVCSTLEHKKDMLVQLSANKRTEAKIYS